MDKEFFLIYKVRIMLKKCFKGNTIVGCSLKQDLESLGVEHSSVIDLQDYYKDEKGPFSLSLIASQLLSNRSGFQKGYHYAIDDARMTLAAYEKMKELQTNCMLSQSAIQKLSSKRAEHNRTKPKLYAEKCMCPC